MTANLYVLSESITFIMRSGAIFQTMDVYENNHATYNTLCHCTVILYWAMIEYFPQQL